jgi:glycosyltransferase involved in cell wall biosynthesis
VSDFSVPEGSIEILSNPVDVEFIRSSMLPIRQFDNGGICYVASGRLTFQKGFDRLLKWFSILDDKRSTLTILGDGDLKNELMRETELLNLQKRVRFVGFCDNPWQWYAGADVFLLPSRWEGMPNSVLEALVCGTSVIATEESGGIKEIVEKSKNNSIIVTISPQQFIHYMKKVKIKNKPFRSNSLLPERYKKENVISIVERWINELK